MYGRAPRDESQYARWPCRHTSSVACPAMGSRCVSVPPPLDVLGRMGASDRLPPMCPVVSVVALDLLRGCDILPPPLAGCFRSIGAVDTLWLRPQAPCPMALMPQTVRISHAPAMAFKAEQAHTRSRGGWRMCQPFPLEAASCEAAGAIRGEHACAAPVWALWVLLRSQGRNSAARACPVASSPSTRPRDERGQGASTDRLGLRGYPAGITASPLTSRSRTCGPCSRPS
jgi:hypothetical protein